MGEFVARIWSPGDRAPRDENTSFCDELALDRVLLGVSDGSVSRTPNAPKVRPVSETAFELVVPEHSARSVLVIEGLTFAGLQAAMPSGDETWRVAPGEIGRVGRLARGAEVSLALVRQIAWERPGPTHHLLVLPRAARVGQGGRVTAIAPALVVLGQAGIELTPRRVVPSVRPREGEREGLPHSFRLAEIEASLVASDALAGFLIAAPEGRLRVPGFDDALGPLELPGAAARLLDRVGRDHLFLPILADERGALLGLACRRRDDSCKLVVGACDPGEFLARLGARLRLPSERPATMIPPPRGSGPAASPSPQEVLARFGGIETRSASFAPVLEQLGRVAPSELGVLFHGEKGAGKEHVARALHAASLRREGPFIAVDCSALANDRIASELFGHKRGAFRGAEDDQDGAFAAADGGTLFLDEVADAPPRVQRALLRALETHRIVPVGDDSEHAIDVRVLAATSRDLETSLESGDFRQDLYDRLADLTFEMPPLRERPEDISALATALLHELAPTASFSRQAETLLVQYVWPGNVKELKSAVERAILLAEGALVLQVEHFAPLARAPAPEVKFPPHVVSHAERVWSAAEPGPVNDRPTLAQPALERAALLCLSARVPLSSWPLALSQQWHRLFRARWATSEDGRDLRELVRELGMDARDDSVLEVVRRRIEAE